jgi:hypothetical protein
MSADRSTLTGRRRGPTDLMSRHRESFEFMRDEGLTWAEVAGLMALYDIVDASGASYSVSTLSSAASRVARRRY